MTSQKTPVTTETFKQPTSRAEILALTGMKELPTHCPVLGIKLNYSNLRD